MPNPPYAKLLVEVNGGALVSGAIYPNDGDSIQLSGENIAFWQQQKFEIYDFPVGFALPAGWSDTGTGVYFYATDPYPPPFVVTPWGKFMLRLTVNRGMNGSGAVDQTLVDASTALSTLSPLGLADLGFLEANQFNPEREWTGDEKANLRIIEAAVGSLTGELVFYDSLVTQNHGAPGNDGPTGLRFIDVGAAFPGATNVKLRGNVWTECWQFPPAWTQNTSYPSVGAWVQNPGPGGAQVAYVLTTAGTSSATGAGPSVLGSGVSDGAGGTTVWRSAQVSMQLIALIGGTPTVLGSFTTSYTLSAGGALGYANLNFEIDVTGAVLALAGSTVPFLVGYSFDAADTGTPEYYLSAISSFCELVFTGQGPEALP